MQGARSDLLVQIPKFPGRWVTGAACRNHPEPDSWFPTVGTGDHGQAERFREAVRICRSCPVKNDCLDYALDANEQHGIWGGTSERERRRIRRERAKGKRAA